MIRFIVALVVGSVVASPALVSIAWEEASAAQPAARRNAPKEPTWKPETPDSVKQAWRRFDETRQQHATRLLQRVRNDEKELSFAKQGRIDSRLNEPYTVDRSGRRPVYYFRSAADKDALVASAEKSIAETKALHEAVVKGSAMYLTDELAPDREPVVGDIGVVSQIWVVNVVSEKAAIVNINRPNTITGMTGASGSRSSGRAMTPDELKELMQRCDNPVPVWVETVEPIEATDGAYVEAYLPLVFIGTKTYEATNGGQRTILHAKVFRLEDWVEAQAGK